MKFIKPKYVPEANLQAEFYHECRLAHIKCFLEYRSRWNDGKKPGCHFDAVIVHKKNIVAIIEFKKRKKTKEERERWRNGKQSNKYKRYNLPIFLVTHVDEISETINNLKGLMN